MTIFAPDAETRSHGIAGWPCTFAWLAPPVPPVPMPKRSRKPSCRTPARSPAGVRPRARRGCRGPGRGDNPDSVTTSRPAAPRDASGARHLPDEPRPARVPAIEAQLRGRPLQLDDRRDRLDLRPGHVHRVAGELGRRASRAARATATRCRRRGSPPPPASRVSSPAISRSSTLPQFIPSASTSWWSRIPSAMSTSTGLLIPGLRS